MVYAKRNGVCGICGKIIVGSYHVDHIKPISQGGAEWSLDNLQVLHPECHSIKTSTLDKGRAIKGCTADGVPLHRAGGGLKSRAFEADDRA